VSIKEVLDYVNARVSADGGTVGEMYGTENFCLFLYSLVRMERPRVVVELGAGAGVTTLLTGQALRDNGRGRLWTIDNGSDWAAELRQPCQQALGYQDRGEDYAAFMARLLGTFELQSVVSHVDANLTEASFFVPRDEGQVGESKIDLLFADAPPSDARGCIDLLRYYLPRMNRHSSIFIDRASTINHSYLLLGYLVEQLNRQKIAAHLVAELSEDDEVATRVLVRDCKFTLVHLTENNDGKRNKLQNSRAWIRIEPSDYLPHNNVASLVRMTPSRGRSPGRD
jgi:hypothetical protein